MKFTTTQNPETNDIEHVLVITRSDLTKVDLTEFDRALIAECEKSDLISDRLLVLEMLARKLEPKVYIG